jgi:hypothetical protein
VLDAIERRLVLHQHLGGEMGATVPHDQGELRRRRRDPFALVTISILVEEALARLVWPVPLLPRPVDGADVAAFPW